jgi:hypothetical protein
MKRVTAGGFWAFSLGLALASLTGCSGGSTSVPVPQPTITSFTANPTAVTAGASAGLTGVFTNGTGVITPGNISATSGTAVSVTPSDTTTYTLTVTNSAAQTATVTVNAALLSQTIAFANPGPQTVGTPLTLVATSTSGLTVSFASTTTGVCTVSGKTATFIAAGTCTIQATQTGNATYAAATLVTQSFTVNAAAQQSQTITFNNPGTRTVGTPLTLVATASSGLTVSFASQTTTVCTVSGTTATFIVTGTCTIQSTQTGNATYAAATPVSQSFNVNAANGPLTITATSCPGGTQGAEYAGCTLAASGGTSPYTFSLSTDVTDYPPLPEGMSLDATTGVIGSPLIGGQGTYTPEFVVADSTGAKATQGISFAINGSNAFLANIFPSNSIFHHRVDAATTGLPVDTSPAAPMYSAYLPETVKPFFGGDAYANFPNGIPAIEVPYNQPDVAVSTTVYQSYFTSGPIPAYAPIEGTANSVSQGGDGHVLVYLEAGSGNKPALYEMWQGIYEGGPWTDSSNALWPDVTSNNLTPQGNGTSDAAGLPVGPLLVNADEVIGTGTPSAPNGAVQHPIRFTLNHMLNYWVWPATQTAGTGYCTTTGGADIPVESEIAQSPSLATSQIPYPATCTMSGAAGEIYRLKATVETPSCAATSPQAAIIITGFRNYGIILADNGDSGGIIGTPDARWNDNDLSCLRSLILSDFEPVNLSRLMVNNDSGETASSGTTPQTITVKNP